MLQATRRWFRRNRTGLAIAAGAIGVGYLAGQYAIGKWLEARQRMAEEKVSEEKYDCPNQILALNSPLIDITAYDDALRKISKTVPSLS